MPTKKEVDVNDMQVKLVVPPSNATLRRKHTKCERVDKLDVHLSMSKDPVTGQNTMTIGSKINNKWADMSLCKEAEWWNRLHYIPLRYQKVLDQKMVPTDSGKKWYRSDEDEINNLRFIYY
jgi:hypothetical protein